MRTVVLVLALACVLAEGQDAKSLKAGISRVQGALKGEAVRTYSLTGKKGHAIELTLTSSRANWLVMRLFPADKPEGADVLSNYISGETQLRGTFPDDGEYTVLIGIRRAEARRDGRATFQLQVANPPK